MWVIEIHLYYKNLKKHCDVCHLKVTNFCATNTTLFIYYGEDSLVTYNIEDVTYLEVYKEF